jgi:uncharacterized protein
MIALVGAVFLASLLGSTHCAGMCGAFVTFAVVGLREDKDRPHPALLHGAYNLGRLIVYMTLGACAGFAGATLELGASLVGLQHAAAIGAGAMMTLFGVVTLLRLKGVRVRTFRAPKRLQELAGKGHHAASNQPPVLRAFATGLLTTLLPCGWLYAFVVTSAGTANPFYGAIVMAVFWAGTLPVLVTVGAVAKKLTGPLATRVPAIMALALVVVGLVTVFNRAPLIDATRTMFADLEERAGNDPTLPAALLLEGDVSCHEYADDSSH